MWIHFASRSPPIQCKQFDTLNPHTFKGLSRGQRGESETRLFLVHDASVAQIEVIADQKTESGWRAGWSGGGLISLEKVSTWLLSLSYTAILWINRRQTDTSPFLNILPPLLQSANRKHGDERRPNRPRQQAPRHIQHHRRRCS
jgi:hypothetical protein